MSPEATPIPSLYAPRSADSNTIVRAGVGVVALDVDGQILLEKRSDCGWWGLLGGRIEPGESIHTAALREVHEESGLNVEITRLIGVYSNPSDRIVSYPDNIVQLVDIVLEAKILGGTLTCSEESEMLQFFAADNLPAEIVPPARRPIEDYIAGLHAAIR